MTFPTLEKGLKSALLLPDRAFPFRFGQAAQIDQVIAFDPGKIVFGLGIDHAVDRIGVGQRVQSMVRSSSNDAANTVLTAKLKIKTGIVAVQREAGSTGEAATEVLGAADRLGRYAADLEREVAEFLKGVKAA